MGNEGWGVRFFGLGWKRDLVGVFGLGGGLWNFFWVWV